MGECFLTSLCTFSSLAHDLAHRSRGRIFEVNAKVEKGGQIEQFVQFSALWKQF